MPIFKDEHLPAFDPGPDNVQKFQIAWLHRRVENLEALVFELLRDRVNYEQLEGYRKTLENPGFTPSSNDIKNRGVQMAAYMQQGFDESVTGWPDLEKWKDDGGE